MTVRKPNVLTGTPWRTCQAIDELVRTYGQAELEWAVMAKYRTGRRALRRRNIAARAIQRLTNSLAKEISRVRLMASSLTITDENPATAAPFNGKVFVKLSGYLTPEEYETLQRTLRGDA